MKWRWWRKRVVVETEPEQGSDFDEPGVKVEPAAAVEPNPLLEGREVPLGPEEREQLPLDRQHWRQRLNLKPIDIATYLLIAAVVGYILYSLVVNVVKNYQTKKEIEEAKTEIITLQIEKESLQSLLSYYNTKSYQELELRRRLLLKKPGEIVVALNGATPLSEQDTVAPTETKKELPAIWQWYDFYFKNRDPLSARK